MGLVIADKQQDVLHLAVQDRAKIIQSHSADGFVVLEPIQQTATDSVIVDQFIGGYSFCLQGFVKWFIRNHNLTPNQS